MSRKKWGFVLWAVWFVLNGILQIFPALQFPLSGFILAAVGIIGGLLVLWGINDPA